MSKGPNATRNMHLKEHSTFFLEIGSFYNSPRVKELSFWIHSADLRVWR